MGLVQGKVPFVISRQVDFSKPERHEQTGEVVRTHG